MSKVSFISSDDRKYNISRALSLIKSEIVSGLKNAKNIVVKPNCVVTDFDLAATHKDAIDALLEFIEPYAKSQIILAEGSGAGETLDAFKNYDYFSLQDRYNFTIVDLNNDDFETIELFDRRGRKWGAQVAKTIVNANYLISITPPKTHNEVVYTGAIKNVAVGSLLRPEGGFAARLATRFGIARNNKAMIHQGLKTLNANLRILAEKIKIDLAVIDGYSIMQGNGPAHAGELYPGHWALASSDPLDADLMAIKLMGINLQDVGYLSMLAGDDHPPEPFVIGDDWKSSVHECKMHSNFESMRKWK
ncbi:hypothetical protein A2215_04430 [Candidatus Berkelbacteria bacterium RIFOXYA2_FULL_43_10]|uniref:DUF362 domain-containing protein n=1 Tax=Candidatus Berkelbacteria bacterium RIFOXYA2_FULL_43_10 TaxID=1797472 RepID=A0A1F5E3U5_9BACT|nr:MAG: hypothetical protein A2215_04430 [Candidatus Berkelbacteria bacterium RIFOXYA2_FULL_43_10]